MPLSSRAPAIGFKFFLSGPTGFLKKKNKILSFNFARGSATNLRVVKAYTVVPWEKILAAHD
jgi:hypothetical protein